MQNVFEKTWLESNKARVNFSGFLYTMIDKLKYRDERKVKEIATICLRDMI